ncbi:MAG TPA: glycogen debranching N-terminal domain-containing protein [Acidimicrobiales bacterium]
MSEGQWVFGGLSASAGTPGTVVTLVEGTSFCLSARTGDIYSETAQGLFFLDTRFLSRFVLRIDGQRIDEIAVASDQPFSANFVGFLRPPPNAPEGTIAVFRRRYVGHGMVEKILLRNYDLRPRHARVTLQVHGDLADLFAVKEQRSVPAEHLRQELSPKRFSFRAVREGLERSTSVTFSQPAAVEPGLAHWDVELAPRGEWELCVEVAGEVAGVTIEGRHHCDEAVEDSRPTQRLNAWRAAVPVVDTDNAAFAQALNRTSEDLGALRLVDPDHPDDVIVAAGAPWFMTLFGRDSILTSYMAMIVDPDIAFGVLRTLARLQGEAVNPATEEEPGRILHEIRLQGRPSSSFSDGTIYYGSIDATPLFVMLLGEMRRWGLAPDAVDSLLAHADRALDWIERFGDRDGDGYVEYERSTPDGLVNQGWKDSWDGITFADGTLPDGPIALCEVQGYVYAAYLARSFFALEQDDHQTASRFQAKAADLRERFNRDFWIDDGGYVALALDGDKRQVDALASNMGHCLWSGILDPDKAAKVASHLMSDDLFSGWGVRTLATSMGAYNPISYHNGSVWPHDNALIAAGLMRYGHVDAAHRIIGAMLDVSATNNGRLPELLSGISRDELSTPAVYPTSCIPQAWAAASPLLFMRTLLRLDPWMSHRQVWVAPHLPDGMSRLAVSGIPLNGLRVGIHFASDNLEVSGMDPDIELITEPRHPISEGLGRSRADEPGTP